MDPSLPHPEAPPATPPIGLWASLLLLALGCMLGLWIVWRLVDEQDRPQEETDEREEEEALPQHGTAGPAGGEEHSAPPSPETPAEHPDDDIV